MLKSIDSSKVISVYVQADFGRGYRVGVRCRDMLYGSGAVEYFDLEHFALFASEAKAADLARRIDAAVKSGASLDRKHWRGFLWADAVLETVPRK